ncbi:hypothetical protein [Agromyces mangrovi Wang et al. 2018]|uniref:hypothetical protein n=1 Tax=Agromyces mangrovi TaxID=1858653 RepID=UPI0025745930|nr:hypothetical protein [Agromyces mangrovi]BDZ64233.1 hypothetical protein GCM10025877_11710 [Agromyces mangrovi]
MPLRERARAAGGWYWLVNRWLVRIAGPATVGPYETEPPPASAARPCPLCGAAMDAHTFDRSGPKPLMHCPR